MTSYLDYLEDICPSRQSGPGEKGLRNSAASHCLPPLPGPVIGCAHLFVHNDI